LDLYGDGLPRSMRESRQNFDKAFELMNNLLVDPVYLRKLLRTSVEESVKQLSGDPTNIAAIGFCFGGACVIEVSECA
jgi:dienelactone hydrolase